MKVGFASGDWSRTVTDENGHPVWGGSGWARLGQYIGRLSCDVVAGSLIHRGTTFGVRDWNANHHFDCDVVVMQRIMHGDVADKLPAALASGQIIVNDLDDWYWGLSPTNAAFAASHPKANPEQNTRHYRSVLARSSAVTVSTPYLADRISAWVDCPVEILCNTVDLSRFVPRAHEDVHPPVVGWVGSTSHRSGDLEVLRGIVGPMQERGEIRLHHSGHLNGARSFASAVGVPDESVSVLPLVPPTEYPGLFVFDVGVIPLADVPFNLAKSDIKGLELAAAGVPFVASKVGPYITLNSTSGVGRLAKNGAQWQRHITELSNVNTRAEEAEENRQKIQSRDISFGAKALDEFLGGLS